MRNITAPPWQRYADEARRTSSNAKGSGTSGITTDFENDDINPWAEVIRRRDEQRELQLRQELERPLEIEDMRIQPQDKISAITAVGRRMRNEVKDTMLNEISTAGKVNPSNEC
jgi:hypothetical protein